MECAIEIRASVYFSQVFYIVAKIKLTLPVAMSSSKTFKRLWKDKFYIVVFIICERIAGDFGYTFRYDKGSIHQLHLPESTSTNTLYARWEYNRAYRLVPMEST